MSGIHKKLRDLSFIVRNSVGTQDFEVYQGVDGKIYVYLDDTFTIDQLDKIVTEIKAHIPSGENQ